MKFKSNSANPNSGRKRDNDSFQMFYSRNVTVPTNGQNEELIIPVSSKRSPQKFTINSGITKNIVMKKDGKSPYLQADLEKLKQYITVPKNKGHKKSKSQTIKNYPPNRKGARSSLRADRVHTEEMEDDSFYRIPDYNPKKQNNSVIYGIPKKNITISKSSIKNVFGKGVKGSSKQFKSYNVRSS